MAPIPIIRSVRWADAGDAVRIIDQRALPGRLLERDLRTVDEVCDSITTLAVRGAPAIGIVGAMGLVASVAHTRPGSRDALIETCRINADRIRATRPTAVNLPWALDRMLRRADGAGGSAPDVLDALRDEATRILEEDRAMCRRIGQFGSDLIPQGARVLTHCNTGALATGGIGTALGAIYVAAESDKAPRVFADESRPLLQGSRLTAWELTRAGIPVTILPDAAAAPLMRSGGVDLVIVGADRITSGGDVANKIGTYALALAARANAIPFYVAAPWSTFDVAISSGDDIVIEQRGAEELLLGFPDRAGEIAPREAAVFNPAFDVTPAELITAIVSDRGVHRPPYRFG